MFVELEPISVKAVFGFMAGNVMHCNRDGLDRLDAIELCAADVMRGWRGAVFVVLEGVEGCLDMPLRWLQLDCLGGHGGLGLGGKLIWA